MKEILFITSYPPRECGIATYSDDLIRALENKFRDYFVIKVCALETETEKHTYQTDRVKYIFDTSRPEEYRRIADAINRDPEIDVVAIQHEFGFYHTHEQDFLEMLSRLEKPVVGVFHTVLPHPDERLRENVRKMVESFSEVIVMTHTSATILENEYGIAPEKIEVIPHGTHLVAHSDKRELKKKYKVQGRRVLSTFGLLSSGKSIETTLDALPDIIKKHPSVLFLIIGKTHPTVVKQEGEKYREMLQQKIHDLQLEDHVRFVNEYLDLPTLLEYLQLTDIYLFTSRDPNQAVSGTFVYALSCGCACVSTPIPHAKEVLNNDSGLIVDFCNPRQLADAVNRLLANEKLRNHIRLNGLQKIAATAWENSAIAHARLFQRVSGESEPLHYSLPPVNITHLKRLTRDFGTLQFSVVNTPDPASGYTLDDNARALIALTLYYLHTHDKSCPRYIETYLNFIRHCQQPDGSFMNYVDTDRHFTDQNLTVNLDDANGRAVWALGYLISHQSELPEKWTEEAMTILKRTRTHLSDIHSPRALAFIIKGLYYYNTVYHREHVTVLIKNMADHLADLYQQIAVPGWEWFEKYLTYANSILPEAMLYAYLETEQPAYKKIAGTSFDFLMNKIFPGEHIRVISNKGCVTADETDYQYGEQPIDVAYTIIACSKFYRTFQKKKYRDKMLTAFNWFLGENHLHQIIYNPSTGGCYDGLEEYNVNLNQGAESTISYLLARLIIEEFI